MNVHRCWVEPFAGTLLTPPIFRHFPKANVTQKAAVLPEMVEGRVGVADSEEAINSNEEEQREARNVQINRGGS